MFQCGNFIRRDALSVVNRYERVNRIVNGQQTGNAVQSMRQQSIPCQQPQNSAVAMDTQPARMPHQYHQMQQSQVYVLPPDVEQIILNGTMPHVGEISNVQGHFLNSQGQRVSSRCQNNIPGGQQIGTQGHNII